MITDAPPRKVNRRAGFLESDRIKTVDLPPAVTVERKRQRKHRVDGLRSEAKQDQHDVAA
ncbi:MAG: hypothetical protein ABSF15_25000 [Candidatus Sulfotelmatobacter sp.]|jgi:hypothetical protein